MRSLHHAVKPTELISAIPDVGMQFRIGGTRYTVRMSIDPLYDDRGSEAAGLWRWRDGAIWISAHLPLEQRHNALFHELAHAYRHHFGAPGDEEGHANQYASFARDIGEQFERQGGIVALSRHCAEGGAQ